MRSATVQGQQIIDQAAKEANAYRQSAVRYTDEMLKSLQDIITHTLDGAKSRFESFSHSLEDSYQVVSANRQELRGGPEETGEAAQEA